MEHTNGTDLVQVHDYVNRQVWDSVGPKGVQEHLLNALYRRLAAEARTPLGVISGGYRHEPGGAVLCVLQAHTVPLMVDFTELHEEDEYFNAQL